MSELQLLKENKPAIAELVEQWQAKYNRTFDLKDPAEQATFYEGLVELGRHIAAASDSANLNVQVSVQGVSGLKVTAVPN